MQKFSKDGVFVEIYYDTRRTTKNGVYSVKIKVTHKRVRKYYATGKHLLKDEWNSLDRTKNRNLISIRESIYNTFDKVRKICEELLFEDEFNFENLNMKLGRADIKTLNDAVQNKIDLLKGEKRLGNMTIYKTLLNTINRIAGKSVPLDRVTPLWLKHYEKTYLNEGVSITTLGIHMRSIRAIMNEAKEQGLIKPSQYPFGRGKYEIQSGKGRKLALSLSQIKMIAEHKCKSEVTEKYRDIWLFIYLCNGINIADLIHLKYKDIIDDELFYLRHKTKHTTKVQKEIVVTVTEQMKKIIKKWGNTAHPDNYIFPILSGEPNAETIFRIKANFNRELNKRMATVAKELGLRKISSYTARHSFATVLKRSGAHIAYISESLGHTDIKTTEKYLAAFEKEERKKNAELLSY